MQIKFRTELVELMKHLNLPLVAAEVGVAEGNFSFELLQLGIEKLYLIDIWNNVPAIDGCASFEQKWHDKNYNDVLEKIKDYKSKAILLKGFSYKMAQSIPDNSLGLCYIDCDHTYIGAKTDIEAYYQKVIQGGIMAFHDYGNRESYGVYQAVQDFTKGDGVIEIPEDGNKNNLGAYFIKK